MIHFEKSLLRNGLRVIVHSDYSTPFVAVNVAYNVGAKHEQPDRTGFAHLFEHLTFGGTTNIPNFDAPVQAAGGSNNAYTTNDITNYYITIPAQNVETALWLESDRMLGPKFTPKGLAVQKRVVIEEFNQRYLNKPYGDVWHLLRDLCYKQHTYRWPTIGITPDHIANATLKEVKEFFYSHYRPDNAVLVLTGNIAPAEGFRLAEKWFGDIPSRDALPCSIPAEPAQTTDRELTVTRDVPVDTFYIAWHMCSRKEQGFYTLDLLSDILSGGKSSRLEEILVKQEKLFTMADAYLSGENDPGLFVATGKLAEGVDFEFAKNRLLEEILRTAEVAIDQYELDKVKNKVEADLLLNEIGYLEKAMQLASFELLDDASMINNEAERYLMVTPESILAEAQHLFRKGNKNTLNYLSSQKIKS